MRVSTGMPRCTGKWAMSLDGFIAARGWGANGDQVRLRAQSPAPPRL